MTRLAVSIAPMLAVLVTTCASFQKGWAIDPTRVEVAPYYVGSVALGKAPIGHFPVAFDRGAHPAPGYPSDSVMAPLIARMSSLLDDLPGTRAVLGSSSPANGAPEVYVGCALANDLCDPSRRAMEISVRMPTSGWIARVLATGRQTRVEYVMVIAVRMAQFHPNPDGSPLSIGTGRAIALASPVPLGATVQVMELTGALADAQGNVLRAGAEGLLVRQNAGPVTNTEIARLLDSERRTGLPNAPLVWQVALRNLVGQLLRRPDLVPNP
ncbi:MAG: hypothetical protein M3081_16495 [Gemmatimonadota bacterium]|nr:hypothetical protein [Gemmatimonadota bacterium]